MPLTRQRVLGTAGHIDHGKTALVKALTGTDTDRLPAEKQRGITIDLGFAALDLGDVRLSLIDVPGHERFIRNMLAGATGLDLALLVVAADDSVMPQTREHLEILELLGLGGGVIALTKADLADTDWLALVEDELRGLTRGTFLESAPIVRTSATTGAGIEELRSALHDLAVRQPDRDDPGLFRLAIDRSFTVAGHGTVVTGTVASGSAGVGDELTLWPSGRSVRVRGLQQHDRPIERVGRGSRAAVNLAGVHHTEIERGHELAAPGYLVASKTLTVELARSREAPRPIRHRGRYRLHLGTAEVRATVALLDGLELTGTDAVVAQVFVAEPVVAVHGQPFILREESPPATLGGGRVLQPAARRVRRRDEKARERLERLRSPDARTRSGAVLATYGLHPWQDADLARDAGLPLGEIGTLVERLTAEGALVALPLGPRRSVRLLVEAVTDLEDRLLRALGRLHAARPRQSTIRRAHVAAELPDLPGEAIIGALLDRLTTRGAVVADRRTVALRDHVPKLSQAERRLKEELATSIRGGSFSPPETADLVAQTGPRGTVVRELLTLLVDEGRIVEIGPGLSLDADAESDLRRRVAGRLADGSTMTMADLRDLLGTTRKYAVPIGEYLDRIGWTRREGDERRLGPEAQSRPLEPSQ